MTALSFRASAAPHCHSERAQPSLVIPSERSESRNLHLLSGSSTVHRRTAPLHPQPQNAFFRLRRRDLCTEVISPRPPHLRVKLQFTRATAIHAETRRTQRWAERSFRRSRKDFE